MQPEAQPWWREAVTYQIYPRSFADADGDGVGDLPGITARLDHLADLGVDAVWLSPFYVSPQNDHGYDVADYRDVDPLFGTLADADRLLEHAHERGLRVIVDLVPNHTSSAHPWFVEALAAAPGSAARDRYVFREGRGVDGAEPPTNWRSVFGGPAWTRLESPEWPVRAQWYLHLFDEDQPDLNWENPEVRAEFEAILRFWLDRGVDGFRVDVAMGLVKDYRDQIVPSDVAQSSDAGAMRERGIVDEPMWNQPGVHEIYRAWRAILDDYAGDRMMVAEAWTQSPEALRDYLRADEFQQAFNFAWLQAPWSAAAFREVVTETLAALGPSRAAPTWVLSNHDVVRHRSRYGEERGLARARAATLAMLALPGSAYLYQGEELGLPEAEVAPEYRQDPWAESGEGGRDGCRVPLPWSGSEPPYGFGPGQGQPWLPQPDAWAQLSVAAQAGTPGSTLELYRAALAARRAYALGGPEEVELLDGPEEVLAYRRGRLLVALNCGTGPVSLPAGEIVMRSGATPSGELPADTAVWVLTED